MVSRLFSLTHAVSKQSISNLYYFLIEQLSWKLSLRETSKDLHDRQIELHEILDRIIQAINLISTYKSELDHACNYLDEGLLEWKNFRKGLLG